MTCHKVQDLITPYLDNRLSGDAMLEVQDHLSACPSCAEEYALLRQVRLLLGSLKVHQPSETAQCRLMQLLDESLKAQSGADKHFVIGQFTTMTTFVFSRSTNAARQQAIAAQRSRRMAAAAAISAFGMLVIASPFGTEVSNLSARALGDHSHSTASMLQMVSIPGETPVNLSAVTVSPAASPSAIMYVNQAPASNNYSAPQHTSSKSEIYSQQPNFGSFVMYQRPSSSNITFASFPQH